MLPTEALAPVPVGVSSCSPLARGCRALTFNYAEKTTATGENESEWGDYKGNLTRVYFHAWDPAKEAMSEDEVAHYLYDKQGRLRAEWDPRIEASTGCKEGCKALKTIYGYDSEGHVTSITPPGQETWALTYGTIAGSASQGRLLKVTRPSASTALWNGEGVQSTEAPKLSGSPVAGVTMGVSKGQWSNSPVAYSYQWEDCNLEEKECAPIPGATNPNYKVSEHDSGHMLTAVVSVTNGAGTVSVSAPGVLADGIAPLKYSKTVACQSGESFAGDEETGFWIAHPEGPEHCSAKGVSEGSISVRNTVAVAVSASTHDVYVLGAYGEELYKYNAEGEVEGGVRLAPFEGTAVNVDPEGNVWLAGREGKVTELNSELRVLESFGTQGARLQGIAASGTSVYVSQETQEGDQIEQYTYSGEHVRSFGAWGSGVGQLAAPRGLSVDHAGNLWVADTDNERIEVFNANGEYQTLFGDGKMEDPMAVIPEASGHAWVLERALQKWGPGNTVTGTSYSPEPGSTIEYAVPVSGSGAPYELGETEVKAWAQKDDPVEGVALFPPDEPQGWPASDYKRATIHYWDSEGRMVNTAMPTGGIATSEYNATNDVVRTLSADNREAALKEGSKSAEASTLLDTESVYNADGSELLETKGPQHNVKLAGGGEVLARNHVKYFYDEGAPGGAVYGLVTKTSDGAEYEGKEADVRTTVTSYSAQNNLGWKLRKPTSVTIDPGGLNLTSTTVYDETTGSVLESTSPAGSAANPIPAFSFAFGSAGSGEGQFEAPWGVAVNQNTGNVYVSATTTSRVEEFSPNGAFLAWVGTPGSGQGQMSKPEAITIDSSGDIWVGDSGNERIDEFDEKGEPLREFGSKGTGEGQFSGAIAGITIQGSHLWVTDTGGDRLEKFSLTGTFEKSYGTKGSGNGQFSTPAGIVFADKHLYVDDYGNRRVQELTTGGKYVTQFGEAGKGNGQLEGPVGIAADPQSGDLYVSDYTSDRVEQYTESGAFVATLGSSGTGNGQLKQPDAVATSGAGELYLVDSANSRIEAWAPGYSGARTSQTIYYSVKGDSKHPACGKHAEWADLPCLTKPSEQPDTPGLPNLPETMVTYNIWDEPEVVSEAFGSTTRVKQQTYDAAGRALTSEVSASTDKPLPTVTNTYNETTGALETQSTTTEGETQTITSVINKLGQLEKYTDANGVTSTYTYDIDGRIEEVNYGEVDHETASQIYSYSATTGLLVKLYDTAAGMLEASYDAEGDFTTESYPNGMKATYTRNELGEPISLEYKKTTHCSSECTWFSDTIVPSIHGETLKQTSTLAEEPTYTYDAAGRLTQAQEIPAGKGCTTRAYAYDEQGNRLSLTTRGPGGEGDCASEGGVAEAHTYDIAGRLYDSGVSYDALGNTTSLPATAAGGHELKSTYYVDNQISTQEQEGKTLAYSYDPSGRVRETAATGQPTAVLYYAGPGEALTWTSDGEAWTRNIPGIDGTLCATQTNGQAPVLQLHDLQGNIVATASLSETETKLLSTYNSTEFGVPQPGTSAPKYAWLGAAGISSELPTSGVVTTGASSYVPEIGRALQSEPAASPGAFPDGTGGVGLVQATGVDALDEQFKAIALEHEAALEAAARREAEARAFEEEGLCEKNPDNTACYVPEPEEGGAEGGGGTDPWEVLTGKQAHALAEKFYKEFHVFLNEAEACAQAGFVNCVAEAETSSEFYGAAEEKLNGCYHAVHNGRHNKYHEYENGVCWISWEYTLGGIPTNLSVEQCWSESRYGWNEWYCPGHGWRQLHKVI